MSAPHQSTSADAWVIRSAGPRACECMLCGEVDLAVAPELARQLTAALDAARGGRLIVDLSAVTFMDSTGLHALLSLRGRCAAEGVELVLRPGPRVVQRLFALTGSERAFTFES